MNTVELSAWDSFLKCLEDLPQTSPLPRKLFSYLQRHITDKNVRISLKESTVCFNDKNLDLSKQKKVRKIFEIFLHNDANRLTRKSLVKQVYSNNLEEISERQKVCHQHNVVKLISRARKLAARYLEDSVKRDFHWFPYDPCTQTWRLYSIRDDPSF